MPQSELPQTWQIPPDDAPTLGEGGRFRLAVKLGEGGMASVYRAWDLQTQIWVAVKVLLPEYARRRKLRKRFENEATTMMQLEHRHIVKVLAVGTEGDSLPFIAMELADGGCVIDWIDRYGPMPPKMAVDVVMQACKGLKAAHDMGVVHRDVKPHNILITRRGVCRLTDFGIAQVDDSKGMTKTGSVMGTLGYMAPEQRTDSKNVDVRADIYGLGATLYKLVTGGTVADLFLAEHDAEILEGVPASLVPVLLKATAYKPEARHGTVTELARELHNAKKGLDPDPEDTPPLPMELQAGYDPTLTTASDLSEDTYPPMPTGHFDDEGLRPAEPPSSFGGADEFDQEVTDPQSAIPYTMPTQDQRAQDPDYVPDYVDQTTLKNQGPLPEEIALDAETKRKAEEAYQKAFDAGLIDKYGNPIDEEELKAAQERLDTWNPADDVSEWIYGALAEIVSMIARPLQFAAIGIIIVSVFGAVIVGTSASGVRAAQFEAVGARNTLYATLDSEKAIISDLEALGGDAGMLQTYWYDYENPREESDKLVAAIKYISRLRATDKHIRQYGKDLRQSKLRIARERLNRITTAYTVYEARMTEWEFAADSTRGRIAVSVGAASAPDM